MAAARRARRTLILAAGLVVLLALLAGLQYVWLGQVSQAERERMRATLDAQARQFAQEIDREVSRAFAVFRVEPFAASEDEVNASLAEQYQRWSSTSAHPRLLREVLVASRRDRAAVLEHYRPDAGRLESIPWPDDLSSLKAALARLPETSPGDPSLPLWQTDVGPEMLLVPTPLVHLVTTEGQPPRPPQPRPVRVVAVRFDLDYVRNELAPVLAARYFGGAAGLDYHVAIVSREKPDDILYRSAPTFAPASATIDARVPVFGVHMTDVAFIANAARPLERSPDHRAGDRQRFAVSVLSIKPTATRVAVGSLEGGRWELLLSHRAGSLEAAVTRVRRRNLAVSSGILVLLGASVGLIVVSARRAERLAAQQMEFVAGVSHELRTPLSVICSAGENLADGVVSDREQVRRYGSLVACEGRRLTDMVEQVMEFAGMQSGRRAYRLEPVEARALVAGALDACATQLTAGPYEVETAVEEGLPPVMGDAAALRRALLNLLTNAMKYGGDARWIRVRAWQDEDRRLGRMVHIAVEDRGEGLDAGEQARVFEPFYRGRAAQAAQVHGSGLGLAVVRHIVTAHGGRASVESRPGQGSRFTLHLPLDRAPGPAAGEMAAARRAQV